ncbi:MAG: beta-ketoacyl synthase, partial [Bacteroidota bacterium]|nr:beta-ketoacyl synthase [Bacteroidota bacterium]
PGTIKGDQTEFNAIQKLFCNKLPFLTTNKWKVGHTFGASGLLSLEMAVLMLNHQRPIPIPFVPNEVFPKTIEKVMVNAVGFGGNAVSILLSKR